MKTKEKIIIVASILFVVTEMILYCLMHFANTNCTRLLQYASIVLVFVFSLIFLCKRGNVVSTQIALLFTLIADTFLVLINPINQQLGMSSFLVVQICYAIRIYLENTNKKLRLAQIIIHIVLSVVILIITCIVLKHKVDYLSLVSMIYLINLAINMVFAFIQFKKSPLLAIGLLLFIMCDVIVGLNAGIGSYINVSTNSIFYKIAFSTINWAWIFYLPAQVLLALSLINNTNKQH